METAMFGKNKVLGATYGASAKDVTERETKGEALVVNSVFKTIQGEGPHAGSPAIFIRLTGCNLACYFCDTEFEKGEHHFIADIVTEVLQLAGRTIALVVLTGGEPMRQQIVPLCYYLADAGFLIQIETAGTLWPAHVGERSLEQLVESGDVELVCSPKTAIVHSLITRHCQHYKYIIAADELQHQSPHGLPSMSTQFRDKPAGIYRPYDPSRTIWVQPRFDYLPVGGEQVMPDEEQNNDNMKRCVELALEHGYRVSLQTHKILGVE